MHADRLTVATEHDAVTADLRKRLVDEVGQQASGRTLRTVQHQVGQLVGHLCRVTERERVVALVRHRRRSRRRTSEPETTHVVGVARCGHLPILPDQEGSERSRHGSIMITGKSRHRAPDALLRHRRRSADGLREQADPQLLDHPAHVCHCGVVAARRRQRRAPGVVLLQQRPAPDCISDRSRSGRLTRASSRRSIARR